MDGFNQTTVSHGYSSILIEEIALEGLDGITLDVLWIRLKNNPEWCLKPIDPNIKEFIWNKLKSLKDVQWFNIKQPRKTPQIFKAFEDFIVAVEKDDVQPVTFSSTCYPHNLIHDGDIVGSCATYEERIDVTNEVLKLDLSEANERYPNQLVIVASQDVRNHFLFAGKMNPEADIPDISYCILERIGRSRGCGEISSGMQFLKNGANPTFYFWNKLKKLGLITAQTMNFSHKLPNTTLFYLPKFHKAYNSEATHAVYSVVNLMKSSSRKCLPILEVKAMFPNEGRKATKSDVFRRFLKIETVPYGECFPDSSESDCVTKNGSVKVIRAVKLKDENIDPETILQPLEPEDDEQRGILRGARLMNRPLIVQCYKIALEKGVEGASLAEIGSELGLNKLNSRLMMNTLKKLDIVTSLSFDNGRQRYYRFYSKQLEAQVNEHLKEQLGNSFSLSKENSPQKNPSSQDVYAEESEKQPELEGNLQSNNETQDACAVEFSETSSKRKASEEIEDSSAVKKSKLESPETSTASKNDPKKPITRKISVDENVCWLRRSNIILEYLYKNQVTTRADLLRVIKEEETKLGVSTGTPCPKSIRRIISMLSHKNKLTELHKVIVEERLNKRREIFFVCAPTITEDHPIIQTHIANVKKNLSIIHLKSSATTGSVKKLQEIRSKFSKQSRCKENDSKYGMAPKFARMRILHEFLIFLVYHYDGDENLNQEESANYIKNYCSDFDDGEEIPKTYYKEISSRMFVPPLMKYEEYDDGWISVNDVAERIPLKMLFSLVRFSYLVPSIDTYLKHPVKQFYLLRHLPYEIQQILTADKKYISSIYSDIKNLCLIGLAQLGPRIEGRGSLNLVYLNKKTELIDTRPCPPTYFQINTELGYTKYYYDFVSSKNTETYWNDAFRFCVNTRLCRKLSATNLGVKDRKMKTELQNYLLTEHQINEAFKYDTGEIPGDGLGAAGYDSSLYSHLFKQWFPTNNENSIPSPSVSRPVPKQMRLKSNTQLKRMRVTMQKKKPKKKCVAESYDKTDLEALEKMNTLRATWSKTEDEILLMCYVACEYYKPHGIAYSLGPIYRRLLHEKSEVSASKTSLACVRRIKNIMKNPYRRHSTDLFLLDVLRDAELKNNVQSIIQELKSNIDPKDTSRCLPYLHKLIDHVFNHLYENSVVKINQSNLKKAEIILPESLEEFRNRYNIEYIENNQRKITCLPFKSENDVVITVLTSLIYSTLFSQVDKSKSINMNYLYQIFKYYNDNHLNLALSFVRSNRLISMNKYGDRLKSSLLPFGKGTYHFSATFHIILKSLYNPKLFGLVYERFLEFLRTPDMKNYKVGTTDVGINLIQAAFMVHDKIRFDVLIPENLMYFNQSAITVIDPEKVPKPMLDSQEDRAQKTLSLIQNTFFKANDETAKEDDLHLIQDIGFENDTPDDSASFDDKNTEEVLSDNESDNDIPDIPDNPVKLDEELESFHGKRSKLSVFVTRAQFKQSHARFSNAYDHYLIKRFSVLFEFDTDQPYFEVLSENMNRDYCKEIEKNSTFAKISYNSSELSEIVKKILSTPHERDYALQFLDYLQSVGVAGATVAMIMNEFKDFRLLKVITDALVKKKLILRGGNECTRYVHIDYVNHWTVPCWKNVDAFHCEKNPKDAPPVVTNRLINEKFEENNDKNQVWLAIRPWIQINGSINQSGLESLLVRVITHVAKNPGISLCDLQRKFEPALLRQWTRELLEILLELGIVRWYLCEIPKFSLFSKHSGSCSISNCVTGFEDDTSILIEPDVNCLTKLAMFISNKGYEDLLDTKYVSDMSSAIDQPSEVETQDVSQDGDNK